MIRPPFYQKAVNAYWKQKSLTDDEFYFGLGDRIKQRQDAAIPVAGAGTVQFLQLGGAVVTGVAVFVPVIRPAARIYNRAVENLETRLNE